MSSFFLPRNCFPDCGPLRFPRHSRQGRNHPTRLYNPKYHIRQIHHHKNIKSQATVVQPVISHFAVLSRLIHISTYYLKIGHDFILACRFESINHSHTLTLWSTKIINRKDTEEQVRIKKSWTEVRTPLFREQKELHFVRRFLGFKCSSFWYG
jgi:hypothetical protein